MLEAPSSLSKVLPATVVPSSNDAAGMGLAGSVMLIIWTPSSRYAVTSAYVSGPIVTVVMLLAPLSSSKILLTPSTLSPSPNEAAGTGLAGSVMSIIWTPWL